jgi:peptidoglycan-associated lipoprotein
MLRTSRLTMAVAGLALAGVSLGGCATKGFVRQQVAVTQSQVDAQQATLQADDAHLANLDQGTRDALQRAQAAHKLAEGKFLYSMVLSDDSVKFPTAQSELSPEAKTRLLDFAQKLKSDNRNVYVEIQGHTDNTGSKIGNVHLGEARAEAVRLFMNQQGVALNRMSTISYGQDTPVAPNDNPQGRAQNRRVVVIVLD